MMLLLRNSNTINLGENLKKVSGILYLHFTGQQHNLYSLQPLPLNSLLYSFYESKNICEHATHCNFFYMLAYLNTKTAAF